MEKHPQSIDIDQLTLNQLSADAELAKKGLTKTESGTADIVIVYQLAVKKEKEITAYNPGWSWLAGPLVRRRRSFHCQYVYHRYRIPRFGHVRRLQEAACLARRCHEDAGSECEA